MLTYQNIKIFSQKFTLKTDQNRLLRLKKFKKTVPWSCVIEEFNGEDKLQKKNQNLEYESFEI